MMRKFTVLTSALLALGFASATYAAENYSIEPLVKGLKSKPDRVLLVGNSFM